MMETSHDEGASFEVSNPTEAPTDVQPTDQAGIADKPASTLHDLTSLLSEFESATKKPEAKDTNAPKDQSKPQEPVDPVVAALREGLNYDLVRGELNSQKDIVNRLFQHQLMQQEKADFAHVVSGMEQRLKDADIPVGEDIVQRWFESEAVRDPKLREAWDNRHRSERHWRYADKLIGKSEEKLMKFLKSLPDPDVTQDKMAVVAALKGASSSTAPPEGPVRYGELNDFQYLAEKKRLGIG